MQLSRRTKGQKQKMITHSLLHKQTNFHKPVKIKKVVNESTSGDTRKVHTEKEIKSFQPKSKSNNELGLAK